MIIVPGLTYGGANGGQYGGETGGQYGAAQQGNRLELYEPGDIGPTLTLNAVISVSIGLDHSAVSDMEVEIPPFADVSIDRFRSGEMAYYSDGTLLFRSEIDDISQADDYTLTISGVAIEDVPLTHGSIDVSFDEILTENAIQDVLDEYTDYQTIVKPSQRASIDNRIVQQAETGPGFEGILTAGTEEQTREFPNNLSGYMKPDFVPSNHPTTPIAFENDALTITQTCKVLEAENQTLNNATTRSISDASAGEVAVITNPDDEIVIEFAFDHDIPKGWFTVAFRADAGSLGSDPNDYYEVSLNGSTMGIRHSASNISYNVEGLYWALDNVIYDGELRAKDLDAGDDPHTLTISKNEGDDELLFDVIALFDGRFDHQFDGDEQVDSNNSLAYPTLYPDLVPLAFDAPVVGADLSELDILYDFDVVGYRSAGGATVPAEEEDEHNSPGEYIDEDEVIVKFTHSITNDITATEFYPTVFLSYENEPSSTTTPRQGTVPQTLDSILVRVSGEEVSIINEQEFQGSPMSVLQDLHDFSNRRFTIEHGVRPGRGPPTLRSFDTRDTTENRSALDWVITSFTKDSEVDEYANQVTVIGAQRPGTNENYTAIAFNESEIIALEDLPDDDGVRPITIEDDSLETYNDCMSKARSALKESIKSDTVSSSVTAAPILPTPGPQYLVDFIEGTEVGGWGLDWGQSWGATTGGRYSALESVTFSESAGSSQTTLEFEQYSDMYRLITQVQR